jgi:transposase
MDELEAAGLDARLVNPGEAKRLMGGRNKTDKLDARGLALMLRNGTLPEVWIPPAELRDLRGLMRGRLAMRGHTTVLKNRIQAALKRYGTLGGEAGGDLFAKKQRLRLSLAIGRLPEKTRRLPGVGEILGATIHLEIGEVSRKRIDSRMRPLCLRPRTGKRESESGPLRPSV